ncbi:hypothetical protein [Asticcacaulis excentricus]|uniref:Uncharacterized protein n=1 Tax=Asticcacaulis excentricus (strain ATCC 15261 / DSM 4724 / KCTC 12464 / NCIMB 9791 / VKM B-1370 / CB 48) TaxID=573065 RepID=E8RPG4_ASTEC|nr:hypothetical protein [Asticcacaulis excentricus]ADU13062.1 hypothetical protein Astex_1393 [Asticcacaulis excentricus CB 48]
MSQRVRFELDRRNFGVIRFPRDKGQTLVPLKPIEAALARTLDVQVEARRERLFGPKIPRFAYMGEVLCLRVLDSGDAVLDLSHADDEARETIIEHMRLSEDFESF